ncbi:MAG: NAD(P)/FAD-dependent oxidoreductase [Bacilli bacterium]|jgi:glycerol-3-phosphate dehydrogenase|nr:NAD(P)/FAD-dependent oxidoreductase [Bacilli bacterium]MDD4006157.1 NAD(P)/FAD-dependent oxidoreductase [Bacilli bacterium]
MYDVIIIGAGVVGALIAREASKYKLNVLVIDKENDVGNETSMANSAIVHSGYDPLPGSLKARFNVAGNQMFDELADELDFHFGRVGSLTLAFSEEQIPVLLNLRKQARLNNVEVKLLTPEEVLAMEPNINPEIKGALWAESSGIVDPFNMTAHAMENAVDNGVNLHLNEKVVALKDEKEKGIIIVTTDKGVYESKVVINCAGVFADQIAKMIGEVDFKIRPRKGEYLILDHYAPDLVNATIFPLPSEKGKGVLVSPTTSGNYILGPSSEFVDEKDDLATDRLTIDYVKKAVQSLVPSVPFAETIRAFSGLRASSDRGDFIIEPLKDHERFINVAGIESPGLASSPAIAKYVIEELVSKLLRLDANPHFNPRIKPYINMKALSLDEQNALIRKNPRFGQVVCNCEKITLGELDDLMSRSIPPRTVKAVKKRTRAGFGKCQGGFCQPAIVTYLSEYYRVDLTDVLYDKGGSNILRCSTKECKL